MVVTAGYPANPTTLLTKQQRGAAVTSSYDEEKAAMRTDSQSLLKAIQSSSTDTAVLRSMLNKQERPPYSGSQATTGLLLMRRWTPVLSKRQQLPTVIPDQTPSPQLIRRTLTDPPPCHCRTKEVYNKTFSWPADSRAVSTRRDAVVLTRL